MKTLIYKIQLLFFFIVIYGANLTAQNLLNNPESIVFDSIHNRYLVSNWGDGDGKIVQIDSTGTQSYFSTVLSGQLKIAGLYIYSDILLAAAGDAPGAGIAGFDMNTGDTLFFIALPGIGLPNDITSDSNGVIFVTDYWGDRLYKIENQIPSIFIDGGLGSPNGIYYDKLNHRLLILSVLGVGYPILAVNLEDASITQVVLTGLLATDGITADDEGNYYISEWYTDNIYQFDNSFTYPPVLFSSGHNDPADIYYDKVNNLLAIPNFSSNTVDFIPLNSTGFEENKPWLADSIILLQNQPNPFLGSTSISYEIFQITNLRVIIYDSFGGLIKTLQQGIKKPGKYSIIWDGTNNSGSDVQSGIYYCCMQTELTQQTTKLFKISSK